MRVHVTFCPHWLISSYSVFVWTGVAFLLDTMVTSFSVCDSISHKERGLNIPQGPKCHFPVTCPLSGREIGTEVVRPGLMVLLGMGKSLVKVGRS